MVYPERPLGALNVEGGRGEKSTSYIFNFSFQKKKEKKNIVLGVLFSYLGMTVIPSLKLDINLSRTYGKLNCKGEPYRVTRSFITDKKIDRQKYCYF